MTKAYVAFGANLGEVAETYAGVAESLRLLPSVQWVRCSPLYRSAPVGGPKEQPQYSNGVLEIETQDLSAYELFRQTAALEERFGRERTIRWGPRSVDLDLVLFGDEVIERPDLLIPHPRMHFRSFVLRPLLDLNPGAMHPILRRSIATIWQELTRFPRRLALVGDPEFCDRSWERIRRWKGTWAVTELEITPAWQPLKLGEHVVALAVADEVRRFASEYENSFWIVLGGEAGSWGFGEYESLSAQRSPVGQTISLPCVDCRASDLESQLQQLDFFFASATAMYDDAIKE